MKTTSIFIGDIKMCTENGYKYDSVLYKENAVLMKLKDGYLDLEMLDLLCDYGQVKWAREFMFPSAAQGVNSLFVDEKSLIPYDDILRKKEAIQTAYAKRPCREHG